jgi:tetratricopeptide (TPR) repeat protein
LAAGLGAHAASADYDRAHRLYEATNFEQSLEILQALPKDPAVQALIGENYLMLSEYHKATDWLEKAVAAQPASAEYNLWLARAYGRRAETSNVLTAPGYASKAHRYFEKSVELDPQNLDALNDLFDYYIEAPGFLGGGLDKAELLAKRMAAINPSDGYGAEAKLALKRKDVGAAERNLRRAAAAAPKEIGQLITLAKLLSRQGRIQEADKTIEAAEQIAPNSPSVMFAKADLYVKTNRNLDVARQLLKRYLESSLTPDDPPRSAAQKLLRQANGV